MIIRPAHPSDLPYLYDICHLTGDAGNDATPLVSDRFLLGHYYAAPYLIRDPSWCWVAVDDQGPAGYLVATPDSRGFAAWMETDWLPALRALSPRRENPVWSPLETWIRQKIHNPKTFPDFVDQYPAHFHIDLLPRAQRQGWGSLLIGAFLHRSREARLAGVHLWADQVNTKACAFYTKQGFAVIRQTPGVFAFGRRF